MIFCVDKMFYFWLEHGTIAVKISTLKKVIHLILQGEKYPGLLMTIIRFLLPTNDHTLKKLLLIFWEIVPKTTGDGKLLQEMILVCDAYRKVCIEFVSSVCTLLCACQTVWYFTWLQHLSYQTSDMDACMCSHVDLCMHMQVYMHTCTYTCTHILMERNICMHKWYVLYIYSH